jgi:O-methyltransferase domain
MIETALQQLFTRHELSQSDIRFWVVHPGGRKVIDDDRAFTLLRRWRSAMASKGKILIVDMIVPETASASFSKLLDLNMMVMTGGRERTKAEFSNLLNAANYPR